MLDLSSDIYLVCDINLSTGHTRLEIHILVSFQITRKMTVFIILSLIMNETELSLIHNQK